MGGSTDACAFETTCGCDSSAVDNYFTTLSVRITTRTYSCTVFSTLGSQCSAVYSSFPYLTARSRRITPNLIESATAAKSGSIITTRAGDSATILNIFRAVVGIIIVPRAATYACATISARSIDGAPIDNDFTCVLGLRFLSKAP